MSIFFRDDKVFKRYLKNNIKNIKKKLKIMDNDLIIKQLKSEIKNDENKLKLLEKNKYKNIRREYKGRKYQSGKECTDAIKLDIMLQEGKIKKLQYQQMINIYVNKKRICGHIVDFIVTLNDGRIKYVETKGFPTEIWLIKRNLILVTDKTPYLVNPKEKEILE
jgi:hypothetical protein